MRNYLIAMGLFTAALQSRGDVIDGSATVQTGTLNNQDGMRLGEYFGGWTSYPSFFTFKTGTSSAESGNWKLNSLVVNLKTDSSIPVEYNGLNARLYKQFSGSNYNLIATQSISFDINQTVVDSGVGSEVTINFAANSSFGIIGDNNSGLLANQGYLVALDFNFINTPNDPANVWLQNNDGVYSTASGWTVGTSYGSILIPGQGSISTTSGTEASPFAYTINAQAVPEPGTLLLGTFLSAAGFGGWRLRRLGRKKQ